MIIYLQHTKLKHNLSQKTKNKKPKRLSVWMITMERSWVLNIVTELEIIYSDEHICMYAMGDHKYVVYSYNVSHILFLNSGATIRKLCITLSLQCRWFEHRHGRPTVMPFWRPNRCCFVWGLSKSMGVLKLSFFIDYLYRATNLQEMAWWVLWC